MRRVAAMMGAAAMLLMLSTSVFAQAKPDFAGKWTREAPAGGAAAGGGGGGGGRGGGGGGGGQGAGFNCGMTCTITVTGNNLKVDRMQGETAVTTTLDMNGTATYKVSMRGAETEIKTVGKWEGNKLVFSTERVGQDGTKTTATQTLSIEGGKLTVVSNSGREGQPPTTSTYTKG